MSEFKVGDKVRANSKSNKKYAITNKSNEFEGEITTVNSDGTLNIQTTHRKDSGVKMEFCVLEASCFELVSPRKTKNQRITSLEETVEQQQNEINELKVIVHQLRENALPSTISSVEDESEIIDFEGAKYRKVDREACKGDVVMFENFNCHYKSKKPYVVLEGVMFVGEDGDTFSVYNDIQRTPDDVDVYELYEVPFESLQEVQRQAVPCEGYYPAGYAPTKSPNELRAEIIEKAKVFLQRAKNSEFIVNTDKRTVVLLVRGSSSKKVHGRYIAKCNASDVFNEHIGRAIALGRALGLDVSEFEQAVQPTIPVKGMVVELRDGEYYTLKFNHVSLLNGEKIINDTNVIYSEVE